MRDLTTNQAIEYLIERGVGMKDYELRQYARDRIVGKKKGSDWFFSEKELFDVFVCREPSYEKWWNVSLLFMSVILCALLAYHLL